MRSVAELLFRPASVVVYGASSDPDKLSGRPLDYLKRFGYMGRIYAINNRHHQVQGVEAFPSIEEIPSRVDLAVVVVPAASVVEAVSRCAGAGVGMAIVFASGFAEIDAHGAELQRELKEVSRKTGIRILGPNCLGSFSLPTRTFATFSTAFDDDAKRNDSPIALVSQSGAVGTFTYSTMNSMGLGVRYFANTGNQSDATAIELLGELVKQDDVDLLLGHLEDLTHPEALRVLLQSAERLRKPFVILKAGATEAGARAVNAHTASMAGDDREFNDLVSEYGAIRVESMEAMADAALAFVGGRRAKGNRVSIVTLSGGAGAIAADAAVGAGLCVDSWPEADQESLKAVLPDFGSSLNPVDVTGAMINEIGILPWPLEVVAGHEGTDVLPVGLGNADKGGDEIVEALIGAYGATTKPFLVSWTGGSGRPRSALLEAGIPTFGDPVRAVRVIDRMVRYGGHAARPASGPLHESILRSGPPSGVGTA